MAKIKIFVCYRRDDSAVATGRIYDCLETRFPSGQVFVDVDKIRPGDNFRQVLDQEIRGSHLVLVVIGRDWLKDPRLTAVGDYVRTEIEIALEQDIPLIPILLDGVDMPKEAELPASIAPFASRQAARVNVAGHRFRSDMERLIRHIEGSPASRSRARMSATSTASCVCKPWVSGRGSSYSSCIPRAGHATTSSQSARPNDMKNVSIGDTPPGDRTDWPRVRAMMDADIHHDADSPRTTEADWQGAVLKQGGVAVGRIGGRGPSRRPTKEQVAIRLSPEVLAAFRAGSPGWQTRINEALQDWIETHPSP